MADKNTVLVVVLIIAAVLLLQGGIFNQGGAPAGDGTGDFDGCVYQPTASYSTKDTFSSTIVGGTAYYRVNGEPATTTAASNVNKGTEYEYWLLNATTYYVKPVKKVAECGVNTLTANAWSNASVTLSGWDNTNSQVTTSAVYNTSMGANAIANIKITYQGTAKKSAAPFGGVMVVEYNSTISSVTCTGADLGSTGFHLTFSPSATTRTYKVFEFLPSLDDGSGNAKTINCQFLNGATAVGAGSVYYVHFIPANYYLTNNGNIALDTEKYLNSDNTRTQIGNGILLTSYWA